MHAGQFSTMRYPSTCKSNLEVFKREPSRVSSVGFLTLGDALSVAGIDCMRAHHEKITTRLFQSVVNNPSNNIHGLLPKKCSRPTDYLRRQKIQLSTYAKPKQRDSRTLISTRVALWRYIFMTCSLHVHFKISYVHVLYISLLYF